MMTPDDLPDLDALEQSARAATPGPWRAGVIHPKGVHYVRRGRPDYPWCVAEIRQPANAAFIAAANPSAVLALVYEVRRLRYRLQEAEETVARLGKADFTEDSEGEHWSVEPEA